MVPSVSRVESVTVWLQTVCLFLMPADTVNTKHLPIVKRVRITMVDNFVSMEERVQRNLIWSVSAIIPSLGQSVNTQEINPTILCHHLLVVSNVSMAGNVELGAKITATSNHLEIPSLNSMQHTMATLNTVFVQKVIRVSSVRSRSRHADPPITFVSTERNAFNTAPTKTENQSWHVTAVRLSQHLLNLLGSTVNMLPPHFVSPTPKHKQQQPNRSASMMEHAPSTTMQTRTITAAATAPMDSKASIAKLAPL
mmetsp:Transcript_26525/g.40727  ORF Transcript_26525/g.40727 Transcript_26525/m.40727 type:complete len:253 (+) Transcript_26525:172-930(+)